jgi:Peptidase family M28
LVHLAGAIGSRPAGTAANGRAREYLADALTRAGFAIRIQTADAINAQFGVSGRVHNIIAVKEGARREAIGLVAHYDSVAEGPGASDDGIGSAVCVEAGRVLAASRDRQWTVMVLLTDAEENGMLGASAVVADPEVRERLKVVINMEAMGVDAPVRLFETGPANGWLAHVWAAAAPRPRGASFDFEIYKRMPNDTDFSVFKREGIPGLNFAAIGDIYGYHTAIDVPERVTARVLEDAGATVVAIARRLQRDEITRRTEEPATYFDLLGVVAVAWGPETDVVLLALALVLGAVAWGRVIAACWRAAGIGGVLVAAGWTSVSLLVVAGAAIGSVALLRGVREVYHPWYARPGRFALMSLLAGIAAAWLLYRLAAHLPARLRVPRNGAFVWMPALTFWMALAAFTGWAAPRAAYLWVLPLIAAATPLALGGTRRGAVRLSSVLALATASVLWIPDVVSLLGFLVALFGRLPIITPAWMLPSLLLLAALTVVPPLLALLVASGWSRPRFVTRIVVAALALSGACAYRAPAYTPERPMRQALLLVGDGDGPRTSSVLAVEGTEPAVDLGSAAPLLTPAAAVPDAIARYTAGMPFVSLGVTPELPPAGRIDCVESLAASGEIGLAVSVMPLEEGLRARLELPEALIPLRSNWPGQVRGARWSATYVAVPTDGTTFTLALPPDRAGRACEGRMLLRRLRPVDPVTGRAPHWLDRPGIAWDYLVMDETPLR